MGLPPGEKKLLPRDVLNHESSSQATDTNIRTHRFKRAFPAEETSYDKKIINNSGAIRLLAPRKINSIIDGKFVNGHLDAETPNQVFEGEGVPYLPFVRIRQQFVKITFALYLIWKS